MLLFGLRNFVKNIKKDVKMMNYKKGVSRIVDMICLALIVKFIIAVLYTFVISLFVLGKSGVMILESYAYLSIGPFLAIVTLQLLKPIFTKVLVWIVNGFKDIKN